MFGTRKRFVRHIMSWFVPIMAVTSMCFPMPALADIANNPNPRQYEKEAIRQDIERNMAALAILLIAGIGAGVAIYEIRRKVNDVDAQIDAAGTPSPDSPLRRGQLQQEMTPPAQDAFGNPEIVPNAQPEEDTSFTAADARKVASAATTRKKTEAVENRRWRIARLRQEVLGGIREAASSGAEGLQVSDTIVKNDLWPEVAASLQGDGYRIDVDMDEDGNRIGAAIMWGIEDEPPETEQQSQAQDVTMEGADPEASPTADTANDETVDGIVVEEEEGEGESLVTDDQGTPDAMPASLQEDQQEGEATGADPAPDGETAEAVAAVPSEEPESQGTVGDEGPEAAKE